MEEVRITLAVAELLRLFVDDPRKTHYGYNVMRTLGWSSGRMYPILGRLERAGILQKTVETIDPAVEARPARRLYSLTPDGLAFARVELARLHDRLAPTSHSPNAPGWNPA